MGSVVATPACLRHLENNQVLPLLLLGRHLQGDWGDLDHADQKANVDALTNGGRLLSAYVVAGERIYVITEADRAGTTLMLVNEY